MKRILLSLSIVLALSACGKADQERRDAETLAAHESDLKQNVEQVMVTPDGQPVFRLKITNVHRRCKDCSMPEPHWVYFIGNTLTVNRDVQAGKFLSTDVTVIVNNTPMDLVNAKTEIDKLLQQKQDQDLKLYRELEARYKEKK